MGKRNVKKRTSWRRDWKQCS